ncbi:MAG: RQC domain-containing protein, partial [Bacteroidota bacterium]
CHDDTELVDITLDAQKILSCIARMRERFGIATVAEVLKGAASRRVMRAGLDTLPTYGIMRDMPLPGIKDLISRLIAENYLYLTEGRYPVVKLRPAAVKVLKNESPVRQRVVRRFTRLEEDEALFGILRRVRREIAAQEGVPPYLVFADSTLREMARDMPTTAETMLAIKGVGQAKLERYGRLFLAAIQEHLAAGKE